MKGPFLQIYIVLFFVRGFLRGSQSTFFKGLNYLSEYVIEIIIKIYKKTFSEIKFT